MITGDDEDYIGSSHVPVILLLTLNPNPTYQHIYVYLCIYI